ncbi:MAG: hypothetical protein KU29_11665 [Sulfurovum sp. FS06-10]|nr:MAG: hypothetical protein KU29_11665 [Sulfurovum sp. FS06-10]
MALIFIVWHSHHKLSFNDVDWIDRKTKLPKVTDSFAEKVLSKDYLSSVTVLLTSEALSVAFVTDFSVSSEIVFTESVVSLEIVFAVLFKSLETVLITQTTDIIFDSLKYLQQNDNLQIYAYVILENHLHLVASSNDIGASMTKFKKYTARQA